MRVRQCFVLIVVVVVFALKIVLTSIQSLLFLLKAKKQISVVTN